MNEKERDEVIHDQSQPYKSASSEGGKEINPAFVESIKDNLKHLVSQNLDDLLVLLSSTREGNFMAGWRTFVSARAESAERWCYQLRKKGDIACVLSYFLAKALFNLDSKRGMKPFAWCALSAVKALQTIAYEEGREDDSLQRVIVRELIALPLRGDGDSYDRLLRNQIRHFRVSILGTEEDLEQAFEECQTLYQENPGEIENLRTLGWILHDCIRQSCVNLKNGELVRFFSEELGNLSYPDALEKVDPRLVSCYETDLKKAELFLGGGGEIRELLRDDKFSEALKRCRALIDRDPDNSLIRQVQGDVFRRMGKHRSALLSYLSALKRDPDNEEIQISLGWEIGKFLNEGIGRDYAGEGDEGGAALRRDCLSYLGRLHALPHPSSLYSYLLRSATRVIHQFGKDIPADLGLCYLDFAEKWGWENLMEEDYLGTVSKEDSHRRYPSLAENFATTLYRCALTKDSRKWRIFLLDHDFILPAFRGIMDHFPNDPWFPYYYGRMLIEMGSFEEARDFIIRVAQEKMGQFWVWKVLGETFPGDQEKKMVCFCKALCCGSSSREEHFLVSLHEALGDILRERGQDGEALCEYNLVDRIRAGKGWKPLRRHFDFPAWSRGKIAVTSNRELYSRYSRGADDLVLDSLPHFDGLVLDLYTDKRRNKEMAKLWWPDPDLEEGRSHTLEIRRIRHDLKIGQPLRIWVRREGDRLTLPKIDLREDGVLWDLYPKRVALLAARDGQRGCSWFAFESGEKSASADWHKFPDLESIRPGTFVEAGTVKWREGRSVVCCWRKIPDPEPLPRFVRKFSGILKIPEGKSFGFVEDILIPASVLEGRTTGQGVEGMAVSAFNPVKKCDGWKAVLLTDS